MFILRSIGRLPNTNPTLAALLTGILSVALIIIGLSSSNDAWPFMLVGGVLLALTGYAAYDTHFFQHWRSTASGRPGHALVRWLGPVALVIGLAVAATTVEVVLKALWRDMTGGRS